ncbi:hypothetical protein Q7P35_001548 [Cladosporium inversicolor]
MMHTTISSSDPTVANTTSAILRLPTELRVNIFEMAIEARRWHVVKGEVRGDVRLQACYVHGCKATVDVTEQCLDAEQCGEKANDPDTKDLLLMNTATLLACRQFCKDAADTVNELKCQNDVFEVSLQPRDTLTAFIKKLTQRQRKAIKNLHVQFPGWNSGEPYRSAQENPLSMISELTGLRYLIINLRGELHQISRIDLRGIENEATKSN